MVVVSRDRHSPFLANCAMAGWFRGAVVSRGFSLLLDDSDDLDDVLGEEDNSISSSFRRVSRGGDDEDGGASSSRVELSPEELASVASRWTFSWVNPLVALGATKALQHDDTQLSSKVSGLLLNRPKNKFSPGTCFLELCSAQKGAVAT